MTCARSQIMHEANNYDFRGLRTLLWDDVILT